VASSKHLRLTLLTCSLLLAACSRNDGQVSEITVAAAANLSDALAELTEAFTAETGTRVVVSYASTAQLAQQIEHGAPFDVFAAADLQHVDGLIAKGKLRRDTRAIYARGPLAVWLPKAEATVADGLEVLASPAIRAIAIATPSAAPYGKAAIEALRNSALWEKVESKIVYASNISMAKQFAATGNVDAAFTASSLLRGEHGNILHVDPALYTPINQAVAVLTGSKQPERARQFAGYLTTSRGQQILRKYGYLSPATDGTLKSGTRD
jgi:molybdate transport system substrate-binding protein